MQFSLEAAKTLLERTPGTLDGWLRDLPEEWIYAREKDGWTPMEIVGHLLHGEHTDWIPRAKIILQHGSDQAFEPFDRTAQARLYSDSSMSELLDRFAAARGASLASLAAMDLQPEDLKREGRHPDESFGIVTLEQLLAAWVVHDQSHIAQIARVLAKQYLDAVGSWRQVLPILDRNPS